jgi:hypothetical protein
MSYQVPVEAGQILQFRRAIGESGAKLEPGGLAPPTFLKAADIFDPQTPSDRVWADAANRPAGRGAGFHAEQTFHYYRHPRAGEVLTATVKPGGRWATEGRRGGHLQFAETITEFTDEAGDLVVTATFLAVRTEHRPEL